MKTISTRIVSSIIFSSVLVAISIGILSVYESSKIIKKEANEKFNYISCNYANEFSKRINRVEGSVDTLVSSICSSFKMEMFIERTSYRKEYMNTTNEMIKNIGETNGEIQGIYVMINPELTGMVFESWYVDNGKGKFIYQKPEDIKLFYPENDDMEWYYGPIREKKGVWTTPYTDVTVNVEMISYTKAVIEGGTLLGVVGIDIAFDDIKENMDQMSIYNTGYGFLLDKEYNIIYHPYLEDETNIKLIENEDLEHVTDAMANNDSGVIEYSFMDSDKVMGFSHLSNGWIFGVVSQADEIFKPIIELRDKILLITIASIFLAGAYGVYLSRTITAPIQKLRDMAVEISKGNHNTLINLHSKDEIGELARSFNLMTRELVQSHNELKEASDDLEYLAYHDALTGLPNRLYGKAKLQEVVEMYKYNLQTTGIMFLDLDDFKNVNDTLGHDIGDEMLIKVAERMNRCVRGKDIVFRIGGDEFLIIYDDMHSINSLTTLAKRLNDGISEPMTIKGNILSVSCSIGIAIVGEHGSDVETLMKNADIALYKAKESGRDTFRLFEDAI